MLLNKYLSILSLFTAILWAFAPKINLLAIPGYEQGIRIEDILFLIIFIPLFLATLIQSRKFLILGGIYGFALTIYMFISTIVSVYLFESSIFTILFSVRWLEYLFMGPILLAVAVVYTNTILVILKSYIVLNACVAPIFFYAGERYQGLSAGPWEVSTVALLSFIAISPFLKSRKQFYAYGICVLIIIISAQARIQLLAYIGILFLFKETSYKLAVIALLSAIYLGAYGAMSDALAIVRFDSISFFKTWEIINTIYENGRNADFNELTKTLPYSDGSTIARFLIWAKYIYKWIDFGSYGIIFGIGPGVGGVVVDGFYIRLLTEFGIVGTVFFIFFFKNVVGRIDRNFRYKLLLAIGIIAITNDPFTSQRIFAAFCLSVGLLMRYQIIKIEKQHKKTILMQI